VIPRLKNDFLEMLVAASRQELHKIKIEEDQRFACTVMAVSGGYPGDYEKGYIIHGIDKVDTTESILFHAGTATQDEKIITNGGRVLCITSFGNSIFEAVETSKEALQNISFTGMSYRRDIGYEFE
jgi:phosphoribosylamine--glycine ligase